MARAPRLSPSSRLSELVDGWLFQLVATKPAANTLAAYPRYLEGVARRIAADAEAAVLHLEHLTKEALRAAFASWATDHAAASGGKAPLGRAAVPPARVLAARVIASNGR